MSAPAHTAICLSKNPVGLWVGSGVVGTVRGHEPNPGFHLTAAPVALWVAGGSLAQPQVNPRSLGGSPPVDSSGGLVEPSLLVKHVGVTAGLRAG